MIFYLVTRLSNAQRGRQELRFQRLVHKKMNSGTWSKIDLVFVVNPAFCCYMSDDFKQYPKVTKYCMLCFCGLVTRLSNAKMVDKSKGYEIW